MTNFNLEKTWLKIVIILERDQVEQDEHSAKLGVDLIHLKAIQMQLDWMKFSFFKCEVATDPKKE